MDIQQPTTLAESRKAPTVIGSGDWLGGFRYALPYDTLQEIHALAGMVCGWRMSLPTKMICQAQKVSKLLLEINRIAPNPKCDKCKGEGYHLLAELGGEKQYTVCECVSPMMDAQEPPNDRA